MPSLTCSWLAWLLVMPGMTFVTRHGGAFLPPPRWVAAQVALQSVFVVLTLTGFVLIAEDRAGRGSTLWTDPWTRYERRGADGRERCVHWSG